MYLGNLLKIYKPFLFNAKHFGGKYRRRILWVDFSGNVGMAPLACNSKYCRYQQRIWFTHWLANNPETETSTHRMNKFCTLLQFWSRRLNIVLGFSDISPWRWHSPTPQLHNSPSSVSSANFRVKHSSSERARERESKTQYRMKCTFSAGGKQLITPAMRTCRLYWWFNYSIGLCALCYIIQNLPHACYINHQQTSSIFD